MKKFLIGGIIFFIGFACCLILTHGLLQAQSSVNEGNIMEKLNDIAKGQEELAAVVNSMKEDIAIIKIRITQMQ